MFDKNYTTNIVNKSILLLSNLYKINLLIITSIHQVLLNTMKKSITTRNTFEILLLNNTFKITRQIQMNIKSLNILVIIFLFYLKILV